MIQDERFRRIHLMLGEEACERLRGAYVTIVGLGAVGSYALEGLARAGVGKFKLVDFDEVSPSNINRQLLALSSTIGRPKCEVARERVLDINPDCQVEAVRAFLDGDSVLNLIGDGQDIVIDAIDSLNPKVGLLEAARNNDISIISCLGAALRIDPTCVQVSTIEKAFGCPLGRTVRTRLRRRGVPVDIPCIYSNEPMPNPLPLIPPIPDPDENLGIAQGRQRNTLGSMPTITGIFGLTAANLAIQMIIGRE